MEASHSQVRTHHLVTDSPILDVEGGHVGGHHVVEQGTDQGELEALSREEVGQNHPEDGANVPTSEDRFQQLLYWRFPSAWLSINYKG